MKPGITKDVEKMSNKKTIEGTITDLVTDFLHYDRKEDEDLPMGAIEEAVRSGEITIDEMVEVFRKGLVENLGQ